MAKNHERPMLDADVTEPEIDDRPRSIGRHVVRSLFIDKTFYMSYFEAECGEVPFPD